MLPRSYALGAAIALAAVSAYGAHRFPGYDARPASEYAVKAERAGLTIGVEPMEDLKAQKTYFNAELTPKGFMPVFIVVQNGSATDSFLFEKGNVGYAGVASEATPKVGSKVGQGMAAAGLGGIIAIKLIANATEVQENLLKQEVQSTTLAPGASVHGFLYIPVPKKGPREKIHLQVPMTKAGTSETFVLNLIL